jgi:opacity protein-like surface antigen
MRIIPFLAALLIIIASMSGTSASSASAQQSRMELGLGIQGGDPDIKFAGTTGSLDTDQGVAISAAYWKDGITANKNISFGVEFLNLRNSDFNESATFLDGALSGTLDIEPEINALMINGAYRSNSDQQKLHPYVGAGIGFARASADVNATATVTVNGTTFQAAGIANDNDLSVAFQAYAGLDYDLSKGWYVGANARYFATDAQLFGADVEFRSWALMAKVGKKF